MGWADPARFLAVWSEYPVNKLDLSKGLGAHVQGSALHSFCTAVFHWKLDAIRSAFARNEGGPCLSVVVVICIMLYMMMVVVVVMMMMVTMMMMMMMQSYIYTQTLHAILASSVRSVG